MSVVKHVIHVLLNTDGEKKSDKLLYQILIEHQRMYSVFIIVIAITIMKSSISAE